MSTTTARRPVPPASPSPLEANGGNELLVPSQAVADVVDDLRADLAAVQAVIKTVSGARTRGEAVDLALTGVRDAFGWAYGSYWRVHPEDNALHFFAESGQVNEEFRRVTQEATFAEGVGLAGRTWRARASRSSRTSAKSPTALGPR